ncbi:MAG: chemotaxis protein CheW, partial [Hydrogenophaga sp.]|nr:chemotaxis protein CheW [Hydrogenophaga sp.]
YNEITATIVLNLGQRVVGIVVDSVSDVVALSAAQIKEPPQLTGGIDTAYVTGIATQAQASGSDERMLILVAIEKLINETELAVAGEAAH